MSKINDGTNDITMITSDKSRSQFAKCFIFQDEGDYFDGPRSRNPGQISPSLGMDYLKASEWKLEPERKGTVPEGSEFQHPEGTTTYANEIYSIDGEKYAAQNISGKVLNQILPIFV